MSSVDVFTPRLFLAFMFGNITVHFTTGDKVGERWVTKENFLAGKLFARSEEDQKRLAKHFETTC